MPATPVLPYRDVLGYAMVMEYYDVIEPCRHVPAFDAARGLGGFFPDEYSLLDAWNELRGFADMGGLVYPQIQGVDFRRDVPRLGTQLAIVGSRGTIASVLLGSTGMHLLHHADCAVWIARAAKDGTP